MDNIKKAGIIVGATVGGLVGGTVSFVGKMTKVKFLDDLGGNIMDSTILTGGIIGEAASGATHLAAGKLKKQPAKINRGKKQVKRAGMGIVGNWITNFKLVMDEGGVIKDGILERDGEKIKDSAQTLTKVATVGFMTSGAIRVPRTSYAEVKRKLKEQRKAAKKAAAGGGNAENDDCGS